MRITVYAIVAGRVRFLDKPRGYGIVNLPDGRTVLVLARMMREFSAPFLPGMICELADVYEGPKGLVASRIISAVHEDARMHGWQTLVGKFYHVKGDYAFADWNGADVYVPGVLFRGASFDARGFRGLTFEAIIFQSEHGVMVHQLRKIARENYA